MIGYKAFNSGLTCRGFQYEIGKSYEMDGEIEICKRGFHFCKNIADCLVYYSNEDARFAKVEAYGNVIDDDSASKCVTNKIRILEEIPRDEAIKMSNAGNHNTGHHNSGDNNSGNYNSGECNSGCFNTGHCNTGNCNTGNCNSGRFNSGDNNTGGGNSGDYNSGDHNTGPYNTGHYNSGHHNSGSFNTGDCNTGGRNTGNCNSGDYNTGQRNIGHYNTGEWNKSSYNTGCFMTINSFIMMFNKPSNWTFSDWLNSKARFIMIICPHDRNNRQIWWDKLSDNNKNEVMSLPNFDPDVFYECTGIQVKKE